jgi:hypothetical protein
VSNGGQLAASRHIARAWPPAPASSRPRVTAFQIALAIDEAA